MNNVCKGLFVLAAVILCGGLIRSCCLNNEPQEVLDKTITFAIPYSGPLQGNDPLIPEKPLLIELSDDITFVPQDISPVELSSPARSFTSQDTNNPNANPNTNPINPVIVYPSVVYVPVMNPTCQSHASGCN